MAREQGDSEKVTANSPRIRAQDNKKTNSKVQKQGIIMGKNEANIVGY